MNYSKFPILYLLTGYFIGLLILIYWWKYKSNIQSRYLSVLSILFLFWLRYPFIVYNQELNPDESQMITHAMTLRSDHIYWKFVDGHTIGPLSSYLLILPTFLGLAFDYTSARLTAYFLMLGSIFFFYKSLRQLTQSSIAWLGIFPLIFFYGLTQEYDFIHYSSELLSVFLLNVSQWIYLRLTKKPYKHPSEWFLLGLILGIIPFCKLQAVPIALVIGIFALWNERKKTRHWQGALFLISGSMFFPIIVLQWLLYHQLWDDFLTFYIEGNLIYGSPLSFVEKTINLYRFFRNSPNFSFFSLSLCPLLIYGWKNIKKSHHLGLAVSLVFASIFSVLKTGNVFSHYLHLLLYPFTFLAFLIGKDTLRAQGMSWIIWIGTLWIVGSTVYKKLSETSKLAYMYCISKPNLQISPASKLILKYANSNDRMAIWGWVCRYHVETQIPQGATETHPERCVLGHPLREKYYQRYIQDIKYKKPKIFVDAVAPNRLLLSNRENQSHEHFPELREQIESHYIFVGEADKSRIYIRKY